MQPTLVFQEGSQTIRQMPENYLIAHREFGRWICDPDLAADKELATRVFLALFDFDTHYGDGLNLLAKVTPNEEFTKDKQIEKCAEVILSLDLADVVINKRGVLVSILRMYLK
jgi:hypothetical protein